MKFRKTVAMALAATMLSGLFAGCARGGQTNGTTSAEASWTTTSTETHTSTAPLTETHTSTTAPTETHTSTAPPTETHTSTTEPTETNTSTAPPTETHTSTAPPETQPSSTLLENVPEGDYYANKIYVEGDTVIFVDPVTKFLSEGSLSTGSVRALSQKEAYDRFIVTPEFIIYGMLEGGTVLYQREGGNEKYLCDPTFYNGALVEGTLYFVKKPLRFLNTRLHILRLYGEPELSYTFLSNTIYSYFHTSLVFAEKSVFYTEPSPLDNEFFTWEQGELMQLELPTQKRTILDENYDHEPLPKEYIELNDDRLYPVYTDMYNTSTGTAPEVNFHHSCYTFFEGNNMFRYELSVGCQIVSGEEVVYDMPAEKIYDMRIDRQYVMIIYEEEDIYRIYDVGTLAVTELRGNKAVRKPVSLVEYISGSENGVRLDPEEYDKLTPEEAARVYYTAIRRQDRDTLSLFYNKDAESGMYDVDIHAIVYIYRPEKYANYGFTLDNQDIDGYDQVQISYPHMKNDDFVPGPNKGPYVVFYEFSIKWEENRWCIRHYPPAG